MQAARSNPRRVLVVDDGSILLGALGAALGGRGYDVTAVRLAEDAAPPAPLPLDQYCPDVILLQQSLLEYCQEWIATTTACERLGLSPRFLALRQSDQATASGELARSQAVTVCTPADLHLLLP